MICMQIIVGVLQDSTLLLLAGDTHTPLPRLGQVGWPVYSELNWDACVCHFGGSRQLQQQQNYAWNYYVPQEVVHCQVQVFGY